jgi:hypothetical protein
MYWYLMEDVSEDEWEFRLHVMKIHDAASRVRLFKRMIADAADNQRAALQALRDKLAAMPLFQKRTAQQQQKMLGGELIYVNGLRSVVESMNFDEEYFDSVYNYLSAYVHSTPLSYFRDGDYPERVYNALRLEPEQFEHPCADLFLSGTHRGTILNHQLIRVSDNYHPLL